MCPFPSTVDCVHRRSPFTSQLRRPRRNTTCAVTKRRTEGTRIRALRLAQRTARAHLQFPSTSWVLLTNASHGDRRAALDEFARRYYDAVRAFIAAAVRHSIDA